MIIDTTVNISKKNRKIIDKISNDFKISKNEVIIYLIQQYLNTINNDPKIFSRVSYQPRDSFAEWKAIHVYFSPGFYEKCSDLRKIFKLSLSYIIAIAINQYSSNNQQNRLDNYPVQYFFFYKNNQNCSTISIIWGIPSQEELETQLE